MLVARRAEHCLGEGNSLIRAACQHEQVHVQPGGRLSHRMMGSVRSRQPGQRVERAGHVAVQLGQRGGDHLGDDPEDEIPRAGNSSATRNAIRRKSAYAPREFATW
jgi:hypothetical protein